MDNSGVGDHCYGEQLRQNSGVDYQVVTGRDGSQVLALCQSQRIDVILLATRSLPADWGGLLRQIKGQLGEAMPPIIVIGSNDATDAVKALKAGAADYLVEDRITPADLRQSLQAAIKDAEKRISYPDGSAETLRQSEERYRTLFNSMNEGFCVVEVLFDAQNRPLDYRFLEINLVFEQQTGLKNAEGKTARQMLPDLEEHWFEIYGGVALTGEPVRFENGSEVMNRWFEVSAFRVGQPELRKVAILFKDISDRRRAERALRETHIQLEAALTAGSIYTWRWQILDNLVITDRNFAQLFGVDPEGAAAGLPIERFISAIHPEDRERVVSAIGRAIATGTDYAAEYRIHNATGEERWVLARGRAEYNASGEAVGFPGALADITDRKQAEISLRESEARFRTLADNISQFAWMANEQGWIFWYNKRWFDYTGKTFEEMQGWGWRDVHHPDHVERVTAKIRHCFTTGQLWEDTFPLRGRDGQYRWFLSRAIPIRDERGNVLRWFGTNTDITALQQAEQALAQRAQELTQLNQDLNQFAYVVSHDLKAPLRSIRNISEWLQEDLGQQIPPDNQEQLQLLVSRVECMEALINDLLEYSRAGRVKQSPEPIEVAELVAELLDTLSVPPQVTVRFATPSLRLAARRLTLGQVFANLLSNAIKYGCPDQQGEVLISAWERGTYCEFAIADHGPGIDPMYHERIFGIFETLQPTDRTENTGIGLAIVKKLVEAEGGTIRVVSEVGAGTAFYFTWPRQVEAIPGVDPPTDDGHAPG
ncbi:MAG: PAS domain S-box protein [Synechococcales bacterium]|nr:PAS domain S-box protein [Synechococcales bacterium]